MNKKDLRNLLINEAGELLKSKNLTPDQEKRIKELHAQAEIISLELETEGNGYTMNEFRSILKVEKRDVNYSENVFAPKSYAELTVSSLEEKVFIRELVKKHYYRLVKSEAIIIPKRNAKMGAATWGNSPLPDDSLAFGSIILKPEPLNGLVKLDKKIVKVNASGIELKINDALTDQFAETLEAAYLLGDGNNNTPFGIFNTTAVPVGQDVTVGTGITAESFIAAKNKMPSGYSPVWVIHPNVLSAIEGLKDGEGRFIFTNSFRTGEPDMILGIPVRKSIHAPSATTIGSYIAALADFDAGYSIADVEEMELQILTELYSGSNQYGYKGYLLTNGNVVDPSAFVRIKVA